MQLMLKDLELEINKITSFLQKTYQEQGDKNAVIAVSGGIDSALSLTLLTKALGKEKITPVFLPYAKQSIADSKLITKFNNFDKKNIINLNIESLVDVARSRIKSGMTLNDSDKLRMGNIMARSRMTLLYDIAKEKNALVCGTENKSEKYLGYFTRFGDEASDVEPLVHLYKTQVRQLAKHLNLPDHTLDKAPTAGLWENQTDEQELGFTYEQADLVLSKNLDSLPKEVIKKVLARVEAMKFKQEVPYTLDKNNEKH